MSAFNAVTAQVGPQPGQVTPGLSALHAKCDAQNVRADFRIDNHGSIAIITPLTDAGEDWIIENIAAGATFWGPKGLVVEPRYIDDVVSGFQADGLTC